MIVVPITKGVEIIMSIHVCLISWMNLNYKEKDAKKAFPANTKHENRVSQSEEHNCCANNKKNGDYYEYRSLSHFIDKL